MLRAKVGADHCGGLLCRAMSRTIYHNPECGTSRNILALIRNSGEEPCVIEHLKTPPSRAELFDLIGRMGISGPRREWSRRRQGSLDGLL